MIALFGTSADPPTAGHQAILAWLSHQFDHVAVWAADNPFKQHQTLFEHRQTMLQLLIDDLEPPRQNVVLYPDLSDRYTVNTVERAKQRWPEADFTLVMGSDVLTTLSDWYQVCQLLAQVKLLIIPRPGYTPEPASLQRLTDLGAKMTMADLTGPDVSSTAYREKGAVHGLTPTVETYIHQQNLYANA